MHEGFHVVAGIFGGHQRVVAVFGAFGHIPVYTLQCGALLPQPPQIGAGLAAVAGRGLGVAVVVKPLGELSRLAQRQHILRDMEPRHEQALELRLSAARRLVFAVEEIAGAVGCGFIYYHGHRLVQHARAGGAEYLLRRLAQRGLPYAHLRAMHQAVVAAAA